MLHRFTGVIAALSLIESSSAISLLEPAVAEEQTFGETSSSIDRRCGALAGRAVDGGKVTQATMVSSAHSLGAEFASPLSSTATNQDRPFCRVEAVSVPAAGADIKVEIWLPVDSDWNGKYLGTSSGGLERIVPTELAGGVARGYAVAAMDAVSPSIGGPDSYRFAIGHPELAKNYAYRGIHLMTVISKQVLATFYGKKPATSIFAGCSGAGYQAIGEANRYPGDYDGIIAGNPAINFADMGLAQGYRYVVSNRSAASAIPASVLPALADEVLTQCDGIDGLVDGIIDDPRRCKVNFRRLACKRGETESCLNLNQIATAEAIYGGLRDPRNGALIHPGFAPGAELSGGAQTRISGNSVASFINDHTPGPLIWALGSDFTEHRWMTFDFGAEADRHRRAIAPFENSNPDFGAFAARGGKIILYGGWGDSNLTPFDLVNFFEEIQSTAGGASTARSFSRLFMAPGMHHCRGGPGPNSFGQPFAAMGTSANDDVIMAMDRWLTTGVAPDRIIATKFEGDKPSGRILRTRPLCAFPQVARWIGHGSIDDAAQFNCIDP